MTASFVLWRQHVLRNFFEAAQHHDDQILNTLQMHLPHYSWEIAIDGHFAGSRHGFQSGCVVNKICGCDAGCGTGDAVIEISPSEKYQYEVGKRA